MQNAIYQEVIPALNKAIQIRGVFNALLTLACLVATAQTRNALAQRNPSRASGASAASSAPRGVTTRAVSGATGGVRRPHPFRSDLKQIPSSVTLRRYDPAKLKSKGGRAIGDANAARQTTLITYTYLLPGATGSDGVTNNTTNTLSRPNLPDAAPNYQPNWSSDERYIYFTSRRNSNLDSTPNTSGIYNIFRTFPDGSGVSVIKADTSNQIEPNIASDGFRLAYAGGGTINVNSAGVPVNGSNIADGQFATNGFKLYFLDTISGNVTALTERNPQSLTFLDVRHPSWAPGGNQIAFAGKASTDPTHYHIYKVNTDTGNITQLTSGPSNDTAPAWSPDGNVIAITTNATAFSITGSNSPLAAQSIKNTTDIWVVNQNLFTPSSAQVTNSLSVPGSVAVNNRNAAWSTLRNDPDLFIPVTTDPNNNITNSQQYLAFATDRYPITTSNSSGTVVTWGRSPNGSTDIYYLQATIAQDATTKIYTLLQGESPSSANPALPLTTSGPDLNTDGTGHNSNPTNVPEYAASFDPTRATSEDYPTWPQYIHSYRITFQSNSNGQGATTPTENIWASSILDINAPTLIKYDFQNNQVVGVFHNSPAPPPPGADANSYAREFAAGETVRFRLKVADYESGVAAVFLQIKCPDSAPQSSDGIEHKTYHDGFNRIPTLVNPPPYSALDASIATGDNLRAKAFGTPIEEDSQAFNVNPLDPGYNTFPQTNGQTFINPVFGGNNGPAVYGPNPTAYPGTNDFLAGFDDAGAFGGSSVLLAFAPGGAATVNYWLQLHDNGPDPDPAHNSLVSQANNEPRGEFAGDGVWTGAWQTPTNLPSDWYVDVIVFDKAIYPFNPLFANNWKIYDNVWGLTTKPFQVDPRTSVLYVNDYDCGQRLFAVATPTFKSNGLTTEPVGVPTESYMTEIDSTLLPTMWWTYPIPVTAPTNVQPLLNVLTNLGADSYAAGAGVGSLGNNPIPPDPYFPTASLYEGVGGTSGGDDDNSLIPPTQRYAQWRILSRGPIPDSVLNAFAPHQEVQPADLYTAGVAAS